MGQESEFVKMIKPKYPVCEECGCEIGRYQAGERAYTSNGRVLCKDCFEEEAIEYVQDNLEDFCQLIGVAVREVD